MWDKALDRQYGLFSTLIIFLSTGLSIIGTLLSNPIIQINIEIKSAFSIASVFLLYAIYAVIRMAHIERKVGYKIDPPKDAGLHKLQSEENILRFITEVSFIIVVAIILLIVNLLLWSK